MADYTSANMAAKLAGRSGKVIAGIRPTHIELASADAANTIRAAVDVSEMMGSEIHLHVSAQGGLVHIFDFETEENLIK